MDPKSEPYPSIPSNFPPTPASAGGQGRPYSVPTSQYQQSPHPLSSQQQHTPSSHHPLSSQHSQPQPSFAHSNHLPRSTSTPNYPPPISGGNSYHTGSAMSSSYFTSQPRPGQFPTNSQHNSQLSAHLSQPQQPPYSFSSVTFSTNPSYHQATAMKVKEEKDYSNMDPLSHPRGTSVGSSRSVSKIGSSSRPSSSYSRDSRELSVEEKLYELEKILKENPSKELKRQDIMNKTRERCGRAIDPWEPEVLEQIRQRAALSVNDEHKTITLKPKHEAQSRESMCDLLRSRKGILETDLIHNAYPEASNDLQIMVREREIYMIDNKDHRCKVIFPNKIDEEGRKMEKEMNSEAQRSLRERWESIGIPNHVELEASLREGGHKVAFKSTQDYGMIGANKEPSRKKRKAWKNVTNTHLTGKEGDVTKEITQKIENLPDRDVVE